MSSRLTVLLSIPVRHNVQLAQVLHVHNVILTIICGVIMFVGIIVVVEHFQIQIVVLAILVQQVVQLAPVQVSAHHVLQDFS